MPAGCLLGGGGGSSDGFRYIVDGGERGVLAGLYQV